MRRHLLALPLALFVLTACDDPFGGAALQGYVEGDKVTIAAPEGGWVERILVSRGQQVAAGEPLFALDAERETALRDGAAARLAQAEAQYANLQRGGRPEEIKAAEAQVAEAGAALDFATRELKRQRELAAQGTVPRRSVDQAQATYDAALARVNTLKAQLQTVRAPARRDEIAAAEANMESAKAALAEAEWRLSQRIVRARVSGRVEDTLREAGEHVPAGGAVISLLPAENIVVRFFVPEENLAALQVGQRVAIGCDGCAEGLSATVSFIAADAEFTPPVIYSVGNREKLVWLVEARPDGGALKPGQPLDVTLPAS